MSTALCKRPDGCLYFTCSCPRITDAEADHRYENALCADCGAVLRTLIAVTDDNRCADKIACSARQERGRPTHLINYEGVLDLRDLDG